MQITMQELLAKVGELTLLLDGANRRIAELEAQIATPQAPAAEDER